MEEKLQILIIGFNDNRYNHLNGIKEVIFNRKQKQYL